MLFSNFGWLQIIDGKKNQINTEAQMIDGK
jgi:hypothetical protein